MTGEGADMILKGPHVPACFGVGDFDRLAYRIAVMEALQRCTQMPFTETMAGAAAGRPFAVQFRNAKPKEEKRAWLSPKTL